MKNKKLELKNYYKLVVSNPLMAGSLVMFLGSNFYNFGQFVYHFLAGRMLGKTAYGDFASLISILGLISVLQLTVGITVTKFVAEEKDLRKLANFIKWIYIWSLVLGVIISLIILILSPFLNNFLKFSQPQAIYVLSPIILFFVLLNSARAMLQGLLRFNQYVSSLITESIFKIIGIFILVNLGLSLIGATFSLLFGVILAFLIATLFLREFLRGQRYKPPNIWIFIKYSLPVFIQSLAMTSMYSVDLILVKHFFSSTQASIYAAVSILARVVFFGVLPITNVMFPLAVKRFKDQRPYKGLLFNSLILVTVGCLLIIAIYTFFPQTALGVLYGASFLEGASILYLAAIFASLLALASLLTQFYLATGKTYAVWLFGLSAIGQILLIWFIHPDLATVINLSIISSALLVVALFCILFLPEKQR